MCAMRRGLYIILDDLWFRKLRLGQLRNMTR